MGAEIAITFDDCCSSVCERAAPIMAEYGLVGTFFVCGQFVDKPMDYACVCKHQCVVPVKITELERLHATGWDISSHTWNHQHFAKTDEAGIRKALERNIDWLLEHGFDTEGFSYPWGVYSESIIPIVMRYHRYARATVARLETSHPAEYMIRSTVMSAKVKPDAILKLTEMQERTVLFGHRIGPEWDGYTWSEAWLRELCEGIAERGIVCKKLGEMI